MIIQPHTLTLKDGRNVILRSPALSDAAACIAFMEQTARETYFLRRYPEEVITDLQREEAFLLAGQEDPMGFILFAFDGEQAVGSVNITSMGNKFKTRHRAGLGISTLQSYWGTGLGPALLQEALERAWALEYEQVELGVFLDNVRASRLYERFGFQPCGAIPRAFRLKDGTYRSEVQMVCYRPGLL